MAPVPCVQDTREVYEAPDGSMYDVSCFAHSRRRGNTAIGDRRLLLVVGSFAVSLGYDTMMLRIFQGQDSVSSADDRAALPCFKARGFTPFLCKNGNPIIEPYTAQI